MQTPAVAPTDSQNPTDHDNNGSTTSNPVTASARIRTGDRSRPVMNAVADSPAITPARRIDGSKRVITTNQAITDTVTAHRSAGRNRTSSGPHAASTNATFCPDTAVKCDSPLARNRAVMSSGCSRSSPITSPR